MHGNGRECKVDKKCRQYRPPEAALFRRRMIIISRMNGTQGRHSPFIFKFYFQTNFEDKCQCPFLSGETKIRPFNESGLGLSE